MPQETPSTPAAPETRIRRMSYESLRELLAHFDNIQVFEQREPFGRKTTSITLEGTFFDGQKSFTREIKMGSEGMLELSADDQDFFDGLKDIRDRRVQRTRAENRAAEMEKLGISQEVPDVLGSDVTPPELLAALRKRLNETLIRALNRGYALAPGDTVSLHFQSVVAPPETLLSLRIGDVVADLQDQKQEDQGEFIKAANRRIHVKKHPVEEAFESTIVAIEGRKEDFVAEQNFERAAQFRVLSDDLKEALKNIRDWVRDVSLAVKDRELPGKIQALEALVDKANGVLRAS